MTKIRFKFWWPGLGHIALAAVLIWNLLRLVGIRQRILETLTLPITATDPDALRAQLIASLPSLWVWGLTIVSIVITLIFVVLSLYPKLSPVRWWKTAAIVWLVAWAGYFVAVAILANLALSRLFT